MFPAGVYACYSIRLKSGVGLHLENGAVILAAPRAAALRRAPSRKTEWEPFQDYGHNHWRNSLIWGEGLHDISITGSGLIWGKGLSRGNPVLDDRQRRARPAWATRRSR